MSNIISSKQEIHPITKQLLNESIKIEDILNSPDTFYSNRTIYESQRKARQKGFEAEHIVSVAIQMKKYNEENGTNYRDRQTFEKEVGIPDDRCYRLTTFEHIISHLIKAYCNEEEQIIFSNMVQFSFSKLIQNEKEIINKCKEFSILREQGINKIPSKFQKGQIPWNKGRKCTKEEKEKLSNSHKGKHCGTDNPFYGKHHTEEFKNKKRNQIPWNKGKTGVYTIETLTKMSESKKNKNYIYKPNKGSFSKGHIPWNKKVN